MELSLSQGPGEMSAVLFFNHPEMKSVERRGIWEIGDGERIVRFEDDKTFGILFNQRGVRHAFQSKEGLMNDDGSSLLLIQMKAGRGSHPIRLRSSLVIKEEPWWRVQGLLKPAQVSGVGWEPNHSLHSIAQGCYDQGGEFTRGKL